MKDWLIPTIFSILCWGGWAFLPKFSAQHISTRSAIVYQGLGGAMVALLILIQVGNQLETHPQGALLSVIAGMLNFLGVLFYINAISKGSIAIISTLTALYPLVVIALGLLIFRETLSVKQALGVGLALVSISLIAS